MMKNPPHPGGLLRSEIIDFLGLSVDEIAERLTINPKELSEVLDCKEAISPDLAKRLEQAGFSTEKAWLEMQRRYDARPGRSLS